MQTGSTELISFLPMFCPVCRDEYRAGFTRCAGCDVDLVASLDAVPRRPDAAVLPEVAVEEAKVNFCGFETLDEARRACDQLREKKIAADILVDEAPGSKLTEPAREEFWIRVAPRHLRAVADLLGYPAGPVDTAAEDTFNCSACGAVVKASDSECPGCGLSFEE